MAINYYYIDGSVSAGQSTLLAIENESSFFGIGASTDISAGVVSTTTLKVGTGVTINSGIISASTLKVEENISISSGIVTAIGGFTSDQSSTPIKISIEGNTLTFSAVGIGSTSFILA